MTKLEVLSLFANAGGFLTPDEVRLRLQSRLDRRSLYTYLARLAKQRLLERHPHARRGQLAYRLTPRGRARIAYLREHPPKWRFPRLG